jgi:hypothetical protein
LIISNLTFLLIYTVLYRAEFELCFITWPCTVFVAKQNKYLNWLQRIYYTQIDILYTVAIQFLKYIKLYSLGTNSIYIIEETAEVENI